MMYLDLDELPGLFRRRWFWSASGPALARFRREDHIGPQDVSLADAVRDRVEEAIGHRPEGPIRLLTNLSYFGYCFNPVSFYYCFNRGGDSVRVIVAEVNNTPWGERNTYVLDCRGPRPGATSWHFRPTKKMHVSPFISMDVEYDWVLSAPNRKLTVFMANSEGGQRFFDASMTMERRPISGWSLAGVLLRYPFMTGKVMFAIYWEALRLWLKRCPVYPHPAKGTEVIAR